MVAWARPCLRVLWPLLWAGTPRTLRAFITLVAVLFCSEVTQRNQQVTLIMGSIGIQAQLPKLFLPRVTRNVLPPPQSTGVARTESVCPGKAAQDPELRGLTGGW